MGDIEGMAFIEAFTRFQTMAFRDCFMNGICLLYFGKCPLISFEGNMRQFSSCFLDNVPSINGRTEDETDANEHSRIEAKRADPRPFVFEKRSTVE